MRKSRKQYRLNRVTVLGVLLGTVITVTMAYAQLPENDGIVNATVVSTIPFEDSLVNISEGTASGDDPTDCSNNGSVWCTFTPTANISIEVSTVATRLLAISRGDIP